MPTSLVVPSLAHDPLPPCPAGTSTTEQWWLSGLLPARCGWSVRTVRGSTPGSLARFSHFGLPVCKQCRRVPVKLGAGKAQQQQGAQTPHQRQQQQQRKSNHQQVQLWPAPVHCHPHRKWQQQQYWHPAKQQGRSMAQHPGSSCMTPSSPPWPTQDLGKCNQQLEGCGAHPAGPRAMRGLHPAKCKSNVPRQTSSSA